MTIKNESLSLREKLKKHLKAINGPEISMALEHIGIYGSSQQYNYFPSDASKQKPLPKEIVAALFVAYGIKLEDFVCKNGQRSSSKNGKVFTKLEDLVTEFSPPINEQFQSIPLGKEGREDFRKIEFAKTYYHPMCKQAHLVSKRMLVGEFLGKGNNMLPGRYIQGYQWTHTDIFEIIENKLGHTSYKREETKIKTLDDIRSDFQIPQDASDTLDEYRRVLFLSLEDSKNLVSIEEQIYRALFECSIPLFEHICVCLKYLSKNAEFYVSRLIRPYHYAVLVGKEDNDITIVTEYYKYRYDGIKQVAHPDMLMIEKVTGKHCHVYPLYKSYLSDLEYPDELMITKKYLARFMENASSYFTKYIIEKKLEDSYNSLQKILEAKKELYEEIFEIV